MNQTKIVLSKFPMSPSSNAYLMSSRGRLIKTTEARIYDAKIIQYKLRNFYKIKLIQDLVKDSLIRVDFHFVFNKKRVIGKKGQVKQIDYSNRLKLVQDGLAKCLEIDDKFIKSGFCEMVYCELDQDEQIIMVVSKQDKIKTIEELNEELKTIASQ